ncbi:hypothetical protein NDU88_003482 [Pleurodeles waltl]|uniref:L1 transposable element RRM domain-containing protein n=1 Tax=Pleurodeles waltl TaxID=8319 RepID=A0AAV7NIB2_PLEWA|nr:hypothetical protein NDU88_003482 [Pleurodeles waltl]
MAGDRRSWHGDVPSPGTPCGAKRARPRPAAGSQAAALSGEATRRGEARPLEWTEGDIGGGSQPGRYGQCYGGANSGDKISAPGGSGQISGLDHQVAAVESQVALQTDRDQGLLHLRNKLTDLEDRSRRNNICFLGFLEAIEGADILSYLRDTLPKLADTTFDPPLEFQRAHRLGLKRQNGKDRPRPIIACFLRHGQAHQLLQTTRTKGPLRLGSLEIRLSVDFSKETADRRRAFLSLRPRLHHLDVKFGLFEPARMWITKNGE